MGRTRTNKIVVCFVGYGGQAKRARNWWENSSMSQIEQANGFSLYGTPVVQISARLSTTSSATGWIRRYA